MKVIIATYETLYSTPLVEAMLKNPNLKVEKIVKSVSIYGNLSGLQGVFFLLKKAVFCLFSLKFLNWLWGRFCFCFLFSVESLNL